MARIEVGPRNLRRRVGHALGKDHGRLAEGRRVEGVLRCNVSRGLVVVVRTVVDDARSSANHRLSRDLIGEPEPRTEGPGVIMSEGTAAGGLVDHGARVASRARIGQRGREARETAVLFPFGG